MSVGYPTDKSSIDGRAGYIAVSVRNALDDAVRFREFLDQKSVEDLAALGYTAEEVQTLKAAFFELSALNQVANGLASQAEPTNFFWNSRPLWGVN